MRARLGAAAVGLTVVLLGCGSGTTGKTAPPPVSSTSTSTSTIPGITSSTATTVLGHTPAEAAALVKKIYDPYAGATTDTPLVGNCFGQETGRPCPLTLSEVMTADLITRLEQHAHEGTGVDPVSCSQNFPVRVSYDPPAQAAGRVSIVVHTYYGTPPALRDYPIRVTVDTDALKVIDLACPSGS